MSSKLTTDTKKPDYLLNSRIICEDTLQTGKGIIQQLDIQNENLAKIEDTVESNDHLLNRSMHVLRGMTWSGMLYNTFFAKDDEFQTKTNVNNRTSAVDAYHESNRNIPQPPVNVNTKTELFSDTQKQKIVREQDQHMEELSRQVEQIHSMGLTIGHAVHQSNEIADRLSDKINNTNDATLAVLLRTAQLSQRANKTEPEFVGFYQFICDDAYLSLNQENIIVLTKRPDSSTIFRVYCKESNLLGLQNLKTLKFLGISFFGSARGTNSNFTNSEEVYISLDGSPSGLLFLGCNWNGGGWLKRDEKGILCTYTTGIADRNGIPWFTSHRLTEDEIIKIRSIG